MAKCSCCGWDLVVKTNLDIKDLIRLGVDRNIIVMDVEANSGTFTARLLGLMRAVMKRNSEDKNNPRKLTHILLSPEAYECSLLWPVDNKCGVKLIVVDEMEDRGPLMDYYKQELGAVLCHNDQEFLIGLDLTDYPDCDIDGHLKNINVPRYENILLGSF